MLTKKISILLSLQFVFLLIVLLEYFCFIESIGEYSTNLLKYQLLFLYIWTIYSAKLFLPWKHLYFLFLLTMLIFLFSRIFLDIFGFFPFNYASRWEKIYFSELESIELLLYFILSLTLIHFGALLAVVFLKNQNHLQNPLTFSKSFFLIGKIIFLVSIPLFLYKLSIQLEYIMHNGYLSLYSDIKNFNYPTITKGSGTLTLLGYSFILASIPSRKNFFLYSSLFLLTQFSIMLQGSRGGFIITFLFIIWFYYKFYQPRNKDYKLKIVFLFSIMLIIISQAVFALRLGNDFTITSILSLFLYFFYQQGISILVPFHMIHYHDQLTKEGVPYIFDPLLHIFNTSNSEMNFNSLAHNITYFINEQAYLNGEGMGSSFIALLYDLPYNIDTLIYMFIGFFIIYFDRIIEYKRFPLFFVYIIVHQIIWMPRGEVFPSLAILIFFVSVYVLTIIITKSVGVKK